MISYYTQEYGGQMLYDELAKRKNNFDWITTQLEYMSSEHAENLANLFNYVLEKGIKTNGKLNPQLNADLILTISNLIPDGYNGEM